MSIVFKPNVKAYFEPVKLKRKPRKSNKWHKKELELLVNLRALNVSFVDIGFELGRRPTTCTAKVHANELNFQIKEKRAALLHTMLEKYNDTETN